MRSSKNNCISTNDAVFLRLPFDVDPYDKGCKNCKRSTDSLCKFFAKLSAKESGYIVGRGLAPAVFVCINDTICLGRRGAVPYGKGCKNCKRSTDPLYKFFAKLSAKESGKESGERKW